MQTAQKHDRRNTESNIHDNASRPFAVSRHSLKSDNSAHVSKGREMNEMADFFMKCPPSGSQATAHGLSDNEKRSTNIRHSALRMFGRYKKKKPTASEPFQLSESVVSSKTRSGAKHMAISVPKEDNFYSANSDCNLPQRIVSECGSVTVLKPVSEFGELHRLSQSHLRDSAQSSRAEDRQKFSIHGPLIEEYQPNYRAQPKRRRETGASISTVRSFKYPVCTQSYKRQDGQQSPGMDSIHSRSSLSLLSVATSRTCNSPDAPTSRGTSPDSSYHPYSYRSHSSLERYAQTSEMVGSYGPIPSTPKKIGESPSVSPLVFGTGTAKLARSFSGAGVEKAHIVRCSTPNLLPGPVPTSRLPNLPASRSTLSLPAQSCGEASQTSSEANDNKRPDSLQASTLHGRYTNKSREISAQGMSNQWSGHSSMCDSSTQCSQRDIQISPQRISLSSVMTVADLPPDDVSPINNPSSHTRKKRSRKWSSTPDLSAVAAQNALNDHNRNSGTQTECKLSKHSGNIPLRNRDVSTGSRRQERKPRTQLPKDRDLDSRICKMERDNATLLSALNGIVKKFGELNGLGTTLSLEEKKDVALRGLMSTEFTWSVEKSDAQCE